MANKFKKYYRKGYSEIIAYKNYEGVTDQLSISDEDRLLSNDEFEEGFIARNPKNHNDIWYISKKYFYEHFIEYFELERNESSPTSQPNPPHTLT